MYLALLAFLLSCVSAFHNPQYTAAHSLKMATNSEYQMKHKTVLTLALAKALCAAAIETAKQNAWTVCVSLFDDGGNLVCFERMDGTQIGSITVSQEKGLTAVRFKRPTKVFEDMVRGGGYHMLGLPGATPVEGGLPLVIDGEIIGAVGVSGVTSAQDGVVAAAAVAHLEKICGPQPTAAASTVGQV